MKHYTIFTDGALAQSTKNGGFAFLILDENEKLVGSFAKGEKNTTSPRMELLAAIYALASIKDYSKITLYSDSEYVVNGLMKKTKKKANRNYWYTLLKYVVQHDVEFVWTKGHADDFYNNLCDIWAQNASKN